MCRRGTPVELAALEYSATIDSIPGAQPLLLIKVVFPGKMTQIS